MNSNYRQFYCNDPQFFLKVMEQEQAPFNMKIHAFPAQKAGLTSEQWLEMREKVETDVNTHLKELGAMDLRSQYVAGDKIRFLFMLNE